VLAAWQECRWASCNVAAAIAKGQLGRLVCRSATCSSATASPLDRGKISRSMYTVDFLKAFNQRRTPSTGFDGLLNRVVDCFPLGLVEREKRLVSCRLFVSMA
jgi:hypothetical protein